MAKVNDSAIRAIIVVFFYSTLLVGLSYAQMSFSDIQGSISNAEREMKEDETMVAIEMGGSINGIVIGINPASRSITVQDTEQDNKIYNIHVKDSTDYFGAVSISDVYAGDTINADVYSLDGYHVIAETIIVEKRAPKEEHFPLVQKVLRSD